MKRSYTLALLLLLLAPAVYAQNGKKEFTTSLMQDNCTFSSTGRNPYFVLLPGYRLELEGKDGDKDGRLIITVLHETRIVSGVETRIVEERESVNDEIVEISRNFFAICKQTNTVYYFGEEVDMYEAGKITGHTGGWIAEGENKAGIVMPGLPLIGARYYQEIAPGIAMDRAEVISTTTSVATPAGTFKACLKTEETTPLERGEREYKYYAPGIGLVQEQHLRLVSYGMK